MMERTPQVSGGGIGSGAHVARSRHGADQTVAEAIRETRRRWGSGVGVITTCEQQGDSTLFRGATVSSFQVASVDPPVVVIFMEPEGAVLQKILNTGNCAVSILDRSSEFLAERFAGRAPAVNTAFDGVAFEIGMSGCPLLTDGIAWFDCKLELATPIGDHLMLTCSVLDTALANDSEDPLLVYDGLYRRIE